MGRVVVHDRIRWEELEEQEEGEGMYECRCGVRTIVHMQDLFEQEQEEEEQEQDEGEQEQEQHDSDRLEQAEDRMQQLIRCKGCSLNVLIT